VDLSNPGRSHFYDGKFRRYKKSVHQHKHEHQKKIEECMGKANQGCIPPGSSTVPIDFASGLPSANRGENACLMLRFPVFGDH
jgi:hypothetical protein